MAIAAGKPGIPANRNYISGCTEYNVFMVVCAAGKCHSVHVSRVFQGNFRFAKQTCLLAGKPCYCLFPYKFVLDRMNDKYVINVK